MRVHLHEIRDMVSMVGKGFIEGRKPYYVYPQALQVIQFFCYTPEIAPQELIGVLLRSNPVEPVDKYLVDDGSPEPFCRIHARKIHNPARIPRRSSAQIGEGNSIAPEVAACTLLRLSDHYPETPGLM